MSKREIETLPQVYPTVVHMLLAAAEHAPDREALVCGDLRLTWRQYRRCVTAFARELIELGATGERVALVMANSADICIATWAAHMARAQVTPLNPVYTATELLPMLADAAPRVLIHDAVNAKRDRALAAEASIPHVIGAGPGGRSLARLKDGSDEETPPLPAPEDPGTLQFTGGTTGRAKGASLTHRALAVNVSQREALVPNRPDVERMLCVMPLFHCYASHMCLHAMAYSRGTLVVLPRYRPQDVLELFSSERITLFGGAPTLLTGLLNFDGFDGADFRHLTRTYSGSAPLPVEIIHRWEAITNSIIIEGYGQSEAGPVISFNPVDGERKPGSVGIPVPGEELRIVDVEAGTRELPVGEHGEIVIRGPHIMSGYRNRPAETAEVLRDGWLYTGDVAMRDQDGYIFITGRKKEMIIVSGYNVFPREVEEVLHANPDVREAAVVGRTDSYRGELPVAFVVKRERSRIDVDALSAYCAIRLAPYKIPAEFHMVPELPKTAVGKVDKLALARLAAAGRETEAKGEA